MRGIEPRCNRYKLYEEYYLNQSGRGMPAFAGARYQRGHGLGNMLRTLTKLAVPFIKKGAQLIGKQAMKTGMDIAQDAMQGQNIKTAAKRRASEGWRELVYQKGRGGPPGQRIKKRQKIVKKLAKKKCQRGYKRKVSSAKRIISCLAKRQKTSNKDALS